MAAAAGAAGAGAAAGARAFALLFVNYALHHDGDEDNCDYRSYDDCGPVHITASFFKLLCLYGVLVGVLADEEINHSSKNDECE